MNERLSGIPGGGNQDRSDRIRERAEDRTQAELGRIVDERTEGLKAAIDFYALIYDDPQDSPTIVQLCKAADIFENYLRHGLDHAVEKAEDYGNQRAEGIERILSSWPSVPLGAQDPTQPIPEGE